MARVRLDPAGGVVVLRSRSLRVDTHDQGEEIRYLQEHLYQVPPEIAGTRG